MSVTGFTLEKERHGPHEPARLGFWWYEGTVHHGVEWAVIDNHPLMIAECLKRMAARIEEKHFEVKPRKSKNP